MVTTPAPGYFRDFRVRQPLITILLTVPPVYLKAWHHACAGSLRRGCELDFHSASCTSPLDEFHGLCRRAGSFLSIYHQPGVRTKLCAQNQDASRAGLSRTC